MNLNLKQTNIINNNYKKQQLKLTPPHVEKELFFSPFLGLFSEKKMIREIDATRGGILADEMGLGIFFSFFSVSFPPVVYNLFLQEKLLKFSLAFCVTQTHTMAKEEKKRSTRNCVQKKETKRKLLVFVETMNLVFYFFPFFPYYFLMHWDRSLDPV